MTALQTDARRPSRRPLVVGAVLMALVVGAQVAGTLAPRTAPVATDAMIDDPLLAAPPAENADGEAVGGAAGGAAPATYDAVAELARVRADIDFWANRLAADRVDIVAAGKLAEADVALARMTGDVDGYVRAEAAIATALAAQPDYLPAQAQRAAVLVALHRFGEARDAADAVLAGSPDDATALGAVGDASLELGDLVAARTAYTALTAAADGSAARIRTARLAFVTGDPAGAIAAARSAVDAAVDEGLEGDGLAFYHGTLGDMLLATGDAAGARQAFAAALEARPGHPASLVGLARLDAFDGRLDPAIAGLDAAIAALPLPDFLARRSDLLERRGGPDDATHAADDRSTVEAIARLAGPAGSVYDRGLSLYLSDHGLDPERAVRLASDELAVRPDVYGSDALAWALLNAGRAADAVPYAHDALAAGTQDARLWYHAGLVEAATGDVDAARTHLTGALALGPALDPVARDRAAAALATLP